MIQYNESYGNRSQTVDGGGFTLDGGLTRSVLRYNYSHDNPLWQDPLAAALHVVIQPPHAAAR